MDTQPESEANNFINDVFGRVAAMAALRCAVELKLLEHIPLSGSTSLTSLATHSGATSEAIRRILLPLTAMGILSNPAPSEYSHTSLSAAFRHPNTQAYFTFGWDEFMPSFAHLHRWFEHSRWQEPSGIRDCAFAMTHSGSGLFEHLDRNPDIATNFNMMNEHMQFPATGVYPFESTGIDWSRQESLMVDVGGGKGQACAEIIQEHPSMKHRIVLQDQEQVLRQVPSELSRVVQKMPYDFFKPQPVKGAAIYHIRRIFCDWPDTECEQILRNQASAMIPSSRLLIAGFVVPEQGCNPLVAGMDITTLMYAGKERTLEQFRDLLHKSGLEIVKVWTDDAGLVSVIESKRVSGAKM